MEHGTAPVDTNLFYAAVCSVIDETPTRVQVPGTVLYKVPAPSLYKYEDVRVCHANHVTREYCLIGCLPLAQTSARSA